MVKINRKIKIIDVDDNYDDLKLQIQDEAIHEEEVPCVPPVLKRQVTVKKVKPIQPVEEVKQEPIQEPVEEVKQEPIPEPIQEVEPVKNVRVQELVECPDCHKMITPKSFKYSHKKTCSANKPAEPVIEKVKPKAAVVQPPPEPPPKVTQPVVTRQAPLTADERRNQALTNMFMSTLRRKIN